MNPRHLSVRVAGSTSNVGPGFDCLGISLAMHLDVTWHAGPQTADQVVRSGEPVELESGEDLLVRAFLRGRAIADADASSLDAGRAPGRFDVHSEIPFGRGFGSSGAAVAAGLLLGVASLDGDADVLAPELLRAGVELEGHPDNVVASLRGGATLAVPQEGAPPLVLDLDVHPTLGWAVAWPRAPLPTPLARRALPAEVPFADAVENPRRLALLLRGLATGDPELVAAGVQDRLHERYRLPLVPGAAEALAAARRAGAYAATLSGAGSGLVALGPPEGLKAIVEALQAPLGAGARGRAVTATRGAPRVVAGGPR